MKPLWPMCFSQWSEGLNKTLPTGRLIHVQLKREARNATHEFNAQVGGMLVLDDATKNQLVEEMLAAPANLTAAQIIEKNVSAKIAGIGYTLPSVPSVEELHSRMKKTASLKKAGCMNQNRFAKPLTVATGFFFLIAVTGLTSAQSSALSPLQAPPKAASVITPKRVLSKADDFAGLKLTDEQKAQIDQIHQNMKTRKDAVVKDEKLNTEQKEGMLAGYDRMERGQVFKLLTTDQQKEVRQRIRARQVAEQEEKKQPPIK